MEHAGVHGALIQTPIERALRAPGPKRILACDGGGVLGVMSIEILARLEAELRRAHGGGEGYVLADFFDLVCGTSNGAILAACIAAGFSMGEIRAFYVASAPHMFDPASLTNRLRYKYADEPLARRLQTLFDQRVLSAGEAGPVRLGDPRLRCLLMMVLYNYNTDSAWPVTNNPLAKFNDRARDDTNLELPLWQLVRASAASPGYFPPEEVMLGRERPYRYVFVDGAITSYNNPAFLAFQMATAPAYRVNWPTGLDKLLLVSVGRIPCQDRNLLLQRQDLNLWHFAQRVPLAVINAATCSWDMACRTVGHCVFGPVLDEEVGTMAHSESAGSTGQCFSYVRYAPDTAQTHLDELGLSHLLSADYRVMDAVHRIPQLLEIGAAYAARNVRLEHVHDFIHTQPVRTTS